MAIQFYPRAGQILLCDFSTGFKPPEMVKRSRPVVVISSGNKHRPQLATVIPLSTKRPSLILPHHFLIPKKSMPPLRRYQECESWVKGDMIYTVGFSRLGSIVLGKRSAGSRKHVYFKRRLAPATMIEVQKCVLHGLNLGILARYLY
jgi:uncharacterized protein YifN (PemK superfamily)